MGFFDRIFTGPVSAWPYTNMQELNLNWLIGVCMEIKEQWPAEYEQLLKEIENKLGKPVNDGNIGDLLVNIGEGKSQWKPFDSAITSTIIEAVNAWLIAHPEYVTTVQDGAISPAKLDTELYNLYKESGKVQFFSPSTSGEIQGESILMVTPYKTVLFDTNASANEDEVMSYFTALYNAGVFTNIDIIVISHMHGDHIGNLDTILETYPHDGCKVYIPLSPSGYYAAVDNPILIYDYDRIVAYLEDNMIDYVVVNGDSEIVIDRFNTLYLWNSDTESYTYYSNNQYSYNNYSMVSLVKTGSVYSMFPGDIEQPAEHRIYNTHDLPRLFLYAVHHHGVESTEFAPFANKINPEYNLVTISRDRNVHTQKGTFLKLVNGNICNCAFDNFSFVVDAESGAITHGLNTFSSGNVESRITIYVDNSYTGFSNGTEAKPFKSVNEALLFTKNNRALSYEIIVAKTSAAYDITYLNGLSVPVKIHGTSSNKPTFNGFNIENCARITLENVEVKGTGLTGFVANTATMIVIANSIVELFEGVIVDGSDITGDSHGLHIQNSEIRLSYATFKYLTKVNSPYGLAVRNYIMTTYSTFDHCGTVFNQRHTQVHIGDGNNFTNITNYVLEGEIARNMPAIIAGWFLNNTFAAQCNAQAVSVPGYVSASHPCVMISNSKAYDLLTGQEVT